MLRGWTGTSRYLSERKQKDTLVKAGVEERVIYGAAEWPEFVRALRQGDHAAVADLRVFGSRKGLVNAAKEVEAREAILVVAENGTRVDMPTLQEVDRTIARWRGEAALKSPKRASRIGRMGAAARKKKASDGRLAEAFAELFWHDVERYPFVQDALAQMPGWTRTTAWRRFGGREPVERQRRKN